jgi:hypothetical protein
VKNLDTLTKLINETAQQIAKHNRDQAGQDGYFETAKELQAEIETYAKIYLQIAIMKASKELKNESN